VFSTSTADPVAKLEDALASANRSGERTDLMIWAGEYYRLTKNHTAARKLWDGVLAATGKESQQHPARIGLALLQGPGNLDARSIQTLQNTPIKFVLDTQNTDRFHVLAELATQNGDAALAAKHMSEAKRFAEGPAAQLFQFTSRLAKVGPAAGGGKTLSRTQRADEALAVGDMDTANALAQEIITSPKNSEEALFARYLLKRTENPDIHTNRIGVLIPLSGKYEVVGKQIQEALQLGIEHGTGSTVKFVFADSGETPDDAVTALEKLAFKEGVVGVIGPVRTDFTRPVLKAGNAMRMPIVSLTQTVGETQKRPYAFQAMVNVNQYANVLADFAINQMNMQRFAIFSPDSAYGVSATQSFADAVERLGGEIAIQEVYDATSTDLIESAGKLGRKDYKARAFEFKQLVKKTEESGGKGSRAVLPPQMDFDAIFIPEKASRIPIACAALAYEEFGIGTFQPRKNENPVPMLGLSTWNRSNLLNNGGQYVQGSYFTGVFVPDSENNQPFIEDYRLRFKRTPTSLEALVHDAGLLISHVMAKKPQNRSDMRKHLVEVKLSGALTGFSGFSESSREANYNIQILTIQGDAIHVVTNPEDELEPEIDGSNPQ
jgi:ABC-type branched-subunit amino acid transport system substrate-binding protein